MKARSTGADPAVVDLARRRLGRLGSELGAPAMPTPPSAASGTAPPAVTAYPDEAVDVDAGRRHRPRVGRHARERTARLRLVGGRLADAVPPAFHGRFGVTAHHVTVVALVLAAAAVAGAWLLVRSAPEPTTTVPRASLSLPEAAPSPVVPFTAAPPPDGSTAALTTAALSETPTSTTPSSAPSAESAVVVHVTGKVRRPGVVELPLGARVVDALEAAGGARRGTRLAHLNLARLLVDGEQIAVGVRPAVPPLAPAGVVPGVVVPSPEGSLVNINTASQAELEELPGIGPVTATSIIEWRTEHGGFSSVDELLEVSGIGEITLAELRDLVTP